MQAQPLIVACCLMTGMKAAAGAETITIDTVELEVEPLAADDFSAGLDNWVVEGNSEVGVRDGKLLIETPEKGYATVWYREPLDGHQLIRFRARVLPPKAASNINFFFCASLPDGGEFFAGERSGEYAEYHEINNYTMTFTGRREDRDEGGNLRAPGYMRLRKNPGFKLVDENLAFKAEVESDYDVCILKVGKRIKVFVNGAPALDWWDYDVAPPVGVHGGGYAGFRTFWSRLEIDDFAAYRVKSWRMKPIEQLKDLSLETDLSQARIVIGGGPAHRDAAQRIAGAIEAASGHAPETVPDTAVADDLPAAGHLIVLGNLADNQAIRRLYFEFYTIVDRRFPGPGGVFLQTVHDPYGAGTNIVVIGASDAAGLAAATDVFVQHIPDGGKLGRLYEVAPTPEYAALAEWDYGKGRLIVSTGWPLHFALGNYGSRDDPRHTGIVYLLTGDDSRAALYREQMLRWVEKGIIQHLYVPGWMEVWDLMEEHPVFSDEDRFTITKWFLSQLRSSECIGALHIQRYTEGMPHQNHGTRPGIGTFFMARYFKHGYGLPECEVYLNRIASYFDMQADWAKPMCDSSMHQWEATLEDKAIYALASGNERFFSSGAARRAAERALRTTDNLGYLPTFGDAHWGSGASTLLAKAALYYREGRYLWPMSVRPDEPMASTDELLRGFVGDVQVREPTDIIGVSVIPYDRGFWEGWQNLPEYTFFNPPNIPYEKAFDKIAFRAGLRPEDEFLLLDGMVGASHDYDDTNTIHGYSRNGRDYLVTYDGLPSSTIAYHNGVNIIRDGLSTEIPYFAEVVHAQDLGSVLVSQTRLNEFSDADWTRSILMAPGDYFVVIDRVRARTAGAFNFTGHWKTLGEPEMAGDTLTVSQWPNGEEPTAENRTYFHMHTPGHRVLHERMTYRYGLGARYYPYARPLPNRVTQSKNVRLEEGESEFLYALAQETANEPQPRFVMHEVAPGVIRVTDGKDAAYVGAPAAPVKIGDIEVDAELFCLGATTLSVAGGRRVSVGGTVIVEGAEPVTLTVEVATGKVLTAGAPEVATAALPDEAQALLARQLGSDEHDVARAVSIAGGPLPELAQLWQFEAGGEVGHLRAHLGNPGADVRPVDRWPLPEDLGVVAVPCQAGHVSFLDAAGNEVKRLEVGVRVNDVAVDDIDRDGAYETLIARHDCQLQCLDADGETRWTFAPEKEQGANSTLMLSKNSALYVFVAERDPAGDKTICVATGDQRLHGLSPAGERQWMFWSYAGLFGIHGLYDLDGDGVREIVGGNPEISSTDSVYFLDGGNIYAKRIILDGWGSTLSSMAVADLTGDGREEIVIGTGRASLYALDPQREQGEERLWGHSLGDNVRGLKIINDTEGRPLIITGAASEFISAFDAAGQQQWATAVGAPVRFMTTAGSAERPIIVAALGDDSVVTLSREGEITHRTQLDGRPSALTVTGERHDLILVAGEGGTVTALAYGSALPGDKAGE